MKRLSKYATSIVRLEADYDDSVLWFIDPIPYEVTHLSADLIRDLEAWGQFYYDALSDDYEWRSDEAGRHFTEEGRRLAQLLANELGREFSVEFRSSRRWWRKRRFRSSDAPFNPDAAAAFTALADAARQEDEHLRALVEEGATLGWSASRPGEELVWPSDEPDESPAR